MIDPRHPLYDPKCRHLTNWQTLVAFVRWWPRFWGRLR
jgi:hypothetical protein